MSVPSPCIDVCRMDANSGLCEGCLRTLDEIANWAAATDDAKHLILAAIAQRRAAPTSPFEKGGPRGISKGDRGMGGRLPPLKKGGRGGFNGGES